MTELTEDYWGTVVDIDDPTKSGKIRVKVRTVFDTIPTEHIPWAMPRYQQKHEHNLPAIDDVVLIKFMNNDIYYPVWFEARGSGNVHELSDDDYQSAVVFVNKDLSKYGLDGKLFVRHTQSEGYVIELLRNDKSSTINIRSDNTIILTNGKTEHIVHLSDLGISLGTENESAEPGVLGQTNNDSLDKINDFTNELADKLSSGFKNLSSIAGASPYTMPLKAPLILMEKQIKLTVSKWYKSNSKFFIKTKSKIITLD